MTTVSDVTEIKYSGFLHIDSLLDSSPGWNWMIGVENNLYYTFSTSASDNQHKDSLITGDLSGFSTTQRDITAEIFATLSQITGIKFQETTDASLANFHFSNGEVDYYAGYCATEYSYGYSTPDEITYYDANAYIYIDTIYENITSDDQGFEVLYEIILHEIGHGMGLKHPFEGEYTLPSSEDNTSNTLMSYTSTGEDYTNFNPYDLSALNWIYGGDGLGGDLGLGSQGIYLTGTTKNELSLGSEGNDKLDSVDGNDTLDGGAGNDTMIGGKGNDLYYVRDTGDVITEAANEGTDSVHSYLSSYTLGSNIENGRIMGSGTANLTGNSLNNFLYAGRGNNIIDGASGTDTVSYYNGVTGTTGVTVSLALAGAQVTGGSGTDTLISIEHLRGSNNADRLTGNAGANTLYGYDGNDTIDGGTGNDTMIGGKGNDLYYVRDTGDVITEAANEGTDTVYSYLASYTFGSNIESGRIMGSGTANLTGNSLDNFLYAGRGNNIIDGASGNDTVSYINGVTGTTGVTVSLALVGAQVTGGSGTDTLISIEHLRGSNNGDKLTGNTGANSFYGYDGNDTIDGGAGNDTMIGGKGDDYYFVRDTGDVVTEAANEGTDTVYSYLASYTLGSNVENGRIMGTGTANLTGNNLDNFLYAGRGNNIIDGGSGTDTVSYYNGVTGTTGVTVSLALASAQVTGGSGTDTLISIEHLRGSNNADKLTGNAAANTLYGYDGNDTINGGEGNDVLNGGAGNDWFVFDTALGSTNIDTITDFTLGVDKIVLDDDIFTALGITGTSSGAALTASKFQLGAAANDTGDRICYDQSSGKLYYDADGTGGTAAMQFGTLTTKPILAATDFLIIA